jgi:amidase
MGPDIGDVLGGLVVEHVITRSVRDSALLLDATAGPDPGAPYFAAPPSLPFIEQYRQPLRPLSIAFTTQTPAATDMHPECEQAVRDAAVLCEALGHRVTEAAPEYDHQQAIEVFSALWAAGCASTVDFIAERSGRPPQPGLLEPLTQALYSQGRRMSAGEYLRSLQGMHGLARKVAGLFEEYDLFLTSTLATLPPPLGYFASNSEDPVAVLQHAAEVIPVTPIANMTGQPAMSVPLRWSEIGLPVGVHFMGRYGDEATLFGLAAQLEQACPWSDRWPEMIAP